MILTLISITNAYIVRYRHHPNKPGDLWEWGFGEGGGIQIQPQKLIQITPNSYVDASQKKKISYNVTLSLVRLSKVSLGLVKLLC